MTLPDGAALGSTSDPAELVQGDPGSVRTNATTLADEATRVERLARDVDDVAIAGWSGGWGQPAYAAARAAEQEKWTAYAGVLRTTAETLTTYAEALITAQSRAADAIATWERGEGPSIDWGDWQDTFGRNPAHGPHGTYDGGLPSSPFAINLGQVEGEMYLWGADGSVEDYWGDVRVQADGSLRAVGLDGAAGGRIDANGVVAHGHGAFTLLGAEGTAGGEYGHLSGEVSGSAKAEARAEGDLTLGPTGVHAGGELFAGGRVEVGAQADVGGIGGEASVEGWAGAGIAGAPVTSTSATATARSRSAAPADWPGGWAARSAGRSPSTPARSWRPAATSSTRSETSCEQHRPAAAGALRAARRRVGTGGPGVPRCPQRRLPGRP